MNWGGGVTSAAPFLPFRASLQTVAIARDGCVVSTLPLSEMLRGFVDTWNRSRPSTGGRFYELDERTEVASIGAITWLSAETGLPVDTIGNIKRGRYPVTELRVADALVTALQCPEAFHDGTLTIMPNPSATVAARAACCGGSLTGSAARRTVRPPLRH